MIGFSVRIRFHTAILHVWNPQETKFDGGAIETCRSEGSNYKFCVIQDRVLIRDFLQERELAFRRLESDLVGLNEIMNALATMANDQSAVVDAVAENIEQVNVE